MISPGAFLFSCGFLSGRERRLNLVAGASSMPGPWQRGAADTWSSAREREVLIERAKQTSESIEVAVFLALSGGLMDAYSYMARGQVFANAQTGNMLLLGINIADGNWGNILKYAMPVACFAAGIAVAENVKMRCRERKVHWRQLSLMVEVALLVVVAFIPEDLNLLANSLTSLACGIQVQSFRKLHGRGVATTMCIGNLRAGTHELVKWHAEGKGPRSREYREGVLLHYGVIVCFVLGAVLGSRLIRLAGTLAILASPALLLVAFAIMFWDRELERS